MAIKLVVDHSNPDSSFTDKSGKTFKAGEAFSVSEEEAEKLMREFRPLLRDHKEVEKERKAAAEAASASEDEDQEEANRRALSAGVVPPQKEGSK
jgi:hypothetical protein